MLQAIDRAADAAQEAISSPLLESSIDGATRVLLSIAGNKDLGIQEINDAADLVASNVDPDANIIFGTVVDESLGDQVRVTVIATGFNTSNAQTSFDAGLKAAPSRPSSNMTSHAPSHTSSKPASSSSSSNSGFGGGNNDFDIPEFLRRSRS